MICHKFESGEKRDCINYRFVEYKINFHEIFRSGCDHEVFHPGERILDIRCSTHGAPVHNRARQNGVLQFALAIYNSRIQLLN